jgi:hypothetical protein
MKQQAKELAAAKKPVRDPLAEAEPPQPKIKPQLIEEDFEEALTAILANRTPSEKTEGELP